MQSQSRRSFRIAFTLPWAVIISLLVIILLQWRGSTTSECVLETFWNDYEIEGAKREISPRFKEVKFTGGLKIKPGVGLYRDVGLDLPTYVGTPSPEIDAAWSKVINPLNLFMTLDEANVMGTEGMGIEPASGLYMSMPQVLHDLHCLNMIRKVLRLDHYTEMNNSILDVHIDHCIDGLRQSLMCFSDMTLIKEYWTDNKGDEGGMMADFDNVHVCRDFDSIRAWMTGRNAEDDGIWPLVAERLRGLQ
ncbi:hypothetical protein DL98DRAFT_509079 [Cadophora sp. DSE1049]|nr:hypothetical protein DL98DRAFT_509079 [Cadophora sp. DSE1049]